MIMPIGGTRDEVMAAARTASMWLPVRLVGKVIWATGIAGLAAFGLYLMHRHGTTLENLVAIRGFDWTAVKVR